MYTRILAAIDGSETSARALDAALKLARESSAQLVPLYVIDVPSLAYTGPAYDPSLVREAFIEEGKQVIAEATGKMRETGVTGTPRILEADALGDDIPHRIARAARELDADLVVMGTHGRRGWRRLVLGSVAERFLRISVCPVLLVPLRPPEQNEQKLQADQTEEQTGSLSAAPDVAGAPL